MKLHVLMVLLLATVLCACAKPQASAPYVGATRVVSTEARGSYVALAYSSAGNTVYLGRSYQSETDALNAAVAGCAYSDCRMFFSTSHDGCVAFATGGEPPKRWGKGRGATREIAETIAGKYCNAVLIKDICVPVVSLCPSY
jgi:hypothetical protein